MDALSEAGFESGRESELLSDDSSIADLNEQLPQAGSEGDSDDGERPAKRRRS